MNFFIETRSALLIFCLKRELRELFIASIHLFKHAKTRYVEDKLIYFSPDV
jgi:hypothetical protein